ncbi:two-component system response regulator CseB [Saccharopolyspora rosea]|uniref:Two-component system response regulator CseB n=1 Tax=Saccharopolyspora rosea TaxID=524884 RepID=A0ABW3FQ77_9PSEU|nr:two-component system response regulator CseB [Saccharopolyspora rosea]
MREESTRVLLVEDDAVIRETTQLALQRYGHQVTSCADGLAGLAAFEEHAPDVTLLDVMLPRMDGIEVCRRIRRSSQLAVLMLSARTDPLDVVHGLEAGADDYVTKPFDTAVLVARIRAVLRRCAADRQASEPTTGTVVFGDLRVDLASLDVHRDGRLLPLTPTERRLLLEFTAHPGQVLSRNVLLERVWDYAWGGDTRVVDVHVQRLRAKIGKDRIETVRGFGYKLRC